MIRLFHKTVLLVAAMSNFIYLGLFHVFNMKFNKKQRLLAYYALSSASLCCLAWLRLHDINYKSS